MKKILDEMRIMSLVCGIRAHTIQPSDRTHTRYVINKYAKDLAEFACAAWRMHEAHQKTHTRTHPRSTETQLQGRAPPLQH